MADNQQTDQQAGPAPVDLSTKKTVIVDKNSGVSRTVNWDEYQYYIASGNFRDATDQEFKLQRYADNNGGTADRFLTRLGSALPGGRAADVAISKMTGETPEDRALRWEDAQQNSTIAGRFLPEAIATGGEIITEAAGTAAAGAALGPGGVGVGLAMGIGAGVGAAFGLGHGVNRAIEHPEMAAELIASNMFLGGVGGAAGAGIGEGIDHLLRRTGASAAVRTATTAQEVVARQADLLQASGITHGTLKKIFDAGNIDQATRNLAEVGAFSANRDERLLATDRMRDFYQGVFNHVDDTLGNTGVTPQGVQSTLLDDLLAQAKHVGGDQRQAFLEQGSNFIQGLNFQTREELRATVQELRRRTSVSDLNSSDISSMKNFLTQAELRLHELDDAITLPNLSPDEQAAYRKAREYYSTYTSIEDDLLARLERETKPFTASEVGNAVMSTVSIASGNVASALFNMTQFGVRGAYGRIRGPAYMYGALQRLQGQARNNYAASIMQRMGTIAGALVKEGFKEGVAETASSALIDYGLENDEFVKNSRVLAEQIWGMAGNAETYTQYINDTFRDSFAGDPVGGVAANTAAARIRAIALRELPAPVRAGILDKDSDIPELSDLDKHKAQEVFTALADPASVLAKLNQKDGPTATQIRILKEAYPALMQAQTEAVLEAVVKEKVKKKELAAPVKERIRLVLDGGSMEDDPQFQLRLQALHQEMNQRAEAPPSRPSSSFGKSLSKAAQTTAERVGNL